jgi:hypothetical protein
MASERPISTLLQPAASPHAPPSKSAVHLLDELLAQCGSNASELGALTRYGSGCLHARAELPVAVVPCSTVNSCDQTLETCPKTHEELEEACEAARLLLETREIYVDSSFLHFIHVSFIFSHLVFFLFPCRFLLELSGSKRRYLRPLNLVGTNDMLEDSDWPKMSSAAAEILGLHVIASL